MAEWRHTLTARHWARPAAVTHAMGTGTDLLRSRAQLLAEHALLRQQLIVLRCSVKRPAMTRTDRALLVYGFRTSWLSGSFGDPGKLPQFLGRGRLSSASTGRLGCFRATCDRGSGAAAGGPPLAAPRLRVPRALARGRRGSYCVSSASATWSSELRSARRWSGGRRSPPVPRHRAGWRDRGSGRGPPGGPPSGPPRGG